MALKDGLTQYKERGQKFVGVFYKEHETRNLSETAAIKEKDRLIVLRYTVAGKTRTEMFGWQSEGYTPQAALVKIKTFRDNAEAGTGATSLAEERAAEAAQKAAEEEARRAAETETQSKRLEEERKNITFAQYWEEHYFPTRQAERKPGSWKTERSLFTHWIEPALGKLRFHEIAPLHIRGIRKKLTDSGKSLATVRMTYCVIQQLWNMARADGYAAGDSPTKDKTANMPTKKNMNNERERYLYVVRPFETFSRQN